MSTVENVRKYTQKLNVKNVSVNEFFRLEMLELFPTLLAKLLGLVFILILKNYNINHPFKSQTKTTTKQSASIFP